MRRRAGAAPEPTLTPCLGRSSRHAATTLSTTSATGVSSRKSSAMCTSSGCSGGDLVAALSPCCVLRCAAAKRPHSGHREIATDAVPATACCAGTAQLPAAQTLWGGQWGVWAW